MKCMPVVMMVFVLLLSAALSAGEHPGIIPKGAECSSCHANKIKGKTVHSATARACTACHLVQTQDDVTIMNLAAPKEQICSSCHQTSAELQRHSPAVKGPCVDCHDAHSSGRRWLLREKPTPRYWPGVLTALHRKPSP